MLNLPKKTRTLSASSFSHYKANLAKSYLSLSCRHCSVRWELLLLSLAS